jgi:hypothetical protein
MMFKDRPFLVTILLVVIVSFAILSSMNASQSVMKEGFDATKDVPKCADDNVPGCYAVDMDVDYASWDTDVLDKYVLKTEIVPPVCPSCPSVINQHSHDGDVTADNEKLAGTEYNETNITNINNEENVTSNNIENVSTDIRVAEKGRSRGLNNRNNFVLGNDSGSTSNDSKLKEYEKTISDLKGELSRLKQQGTFGSNSERSDTCPPCPAPARCPEPAFSCEKVINYRSPSAGQYLPMPVLNDFSTFTKE